MQRVTLIDNYDSFTFNLVHCLGALGAAVKVWRNDEISVGGALAEEPDAIVLSPGPCTPNEAGICLDLIRAASGTTPIFGVCLGHQAIGQAFGGDVVRAPAPMHGKVSRISHNGRGVFRGLDGPFQATRYHSLIIERSTAPEALEVSAETGDGLIMAVEHRERPVVPVRRISALMPSLYMKTIPKVNRIIHATLPETEIPGPYAVIRQDVVIIIVVIVACRLPRSASALPTCTQTAGRVCPVAIPALPTICGGQLAGTAGDFILCRVAHMSWPASCSAWNGFRSPQDCVSVEQTTSALGEQMMCGAQHVRISSLARRVLSPQARALVILVLPSAPTCEVGLAMPVSIHRRAAAHHP